MSFRVSKRGKILLAALHVGLFLLILKFGVGWLEDGRGSFQNSSSPALSTGKGKEGGQGFQLRKYPPPISEVLKRTGPFLARMDGKPLTDRRTRRRRRGKGAGSRPLATKASSVLNDFRLVGVWLDKADRNFAVIESNSTKHQELVREKGKLQSGATVLKVESDRIVLASGGQQRVLEIYFQPSFQVPPSFRIPPSRDPSRLLVMHPILSRVLFPLHRAPRLLSVLRGLNILSSSQGDPIRAFYGRPPLPGGMQRLVVMRPVLLQAKDTSRRATLVVIRPVLAQAQDHGDATPRFLKMPVRLTQPRLAEERTRSEQRPGSANRLPVLKRASSLVVMSPDMMGGLGRVGRFSATHELADQYQYSAYLD